MLQLFEHMPKIKKEHPSGPKPVNWGGRLWRFTLEATEDGEGMQILTKTCEADKAGSEHIIVVRDDRTVRFYHDGTKPIVWQDATKVVEGAE